MNLVMVGIDYETASLEIREKFSLSKSPTQRAVKAMAQNSEVKGCVLLSTCNRSELYLSLEQDSKISPSKLLCDALGYDWQDYTEFFVNREAQDVVSHLLEVTSGLRSQLRGDDQVLTQTHTALTIAREVEATDAILETLFRNAVASGKKIKTEVPIFSVERSVAGLGIETVRKEIGGFKDKKAIVIGNGEMGRLAAGMMVDYGCDVTITLRTYRKGITVVPTGCKTIPYDKRYELIPECDILLSATASNHYTITEDKIKDLEKIPPYFVDLAVPRDIEETIEQLPGVTCWNVDTLVKPEENVDPEKVAQIEKIMDKYNNEFYRWYSYREKLKVSG